jgi:hypothetical protein
MPGGTEVLARFNKDADSSGIPWFVFLSPEGKPLADSTGPEGNTGFPFQDSEIAHFRTMLEKAGVPEASTGVLVASLRENAKKK